MKFFTKILVAIILILNINLFIISSVFSKELSLNSLNNSEKNLEKLKNEKSQLSSENSGKITNTNNTKKKNESIIVNTVRTHHYEEAEEAPTGSIVNSVIQTPNQIISTPISAAIPTLVNTPSNNISRVNEWRVPFSSNNPMPVGTFLNNNNNLILEKKIGPPPGSVNIPRPIALVSQSPMLISRPEINPYLVTQPGITRMLNFPNSGNSFNNNLSGEIDNIDDLKISSNAYYYNKKLFIILFLFCLKNFFIFIDAFDSIIQGDFERGVDLLVDFLSHSLPGEQENVIIKLIIFR